MNWTRRDFSSMLGLLVFGSAAATKGWGHPLEKETDRLQESCEPAKAPEHKVLTTTDEIWADLCEGNKRFVAGKPTPREFRHLREELCRGQHPQVIVLGCSDSRVCPSLVFDKNLGDLFVVRTAGNIADPVALGSIEYAVEHLRARVLVVLGHEKCGAVAATAAGGKMPTANLEAIAKKIGPVLARTKGRVGGEQFLRRAEEANVHQSASNILQNSPLIQREVTAGKLTIVKAFYRLKTGEVSQLLG